MWTPDPDLEQAALLAFDAELAELDRSEATAATASTLLEAVGTLVAIGAESKVGVDARLLGRLRALTGELGFPELEDGLAAILEEAPRCPSLDPECLDEELQGVVDALRARDRVELVCLGAEVLGVSEALSEAALVAKEAFDEGLRGELWQLVPLGARRTAEAAWMQPSRRIDFWWRSRGAELSADALINPLRAGDVLAVFPEARLASPPLGRRIEDVRARHTRDAHGRPVAFAAGAGAESPVPIGGVAELVEVSAQDASTLVIDVLSDVREGAVPVLVAPDGARFEALGVPDTEQRYRVTLPAEALGVGGWTLELPLVAGDRELYL
jgi:hypothetical protein